MSGWVYDLTDPEVRHSWESSLDREVRPRDPLLDPDSGLAGSGKDALVQQKDSEQVKGSYLTTTMRYQLNTRGRVQDEVLKGHEAAPATATCNTYVHRFRAAVGTSSPIVEQWVELDTLEEGRDALADLFASRFSFACHAHATGLSNITDDAYRLNNTINAVNSEYILRPNSKSAGGLTSSDLFDIDLINDAARYVKLVRPKIRPAMTPWGPKYCVFLGPEQVHSLRNSNSQWFAQMSFAAQGGRIDDNGLYTRALGQYQDFLFFESDFVPPGVNNDATPTSLLSSTRRAWIGGAQALFMAFGRGWKVAPGYSLNRFQWSKESEDYDGQHAMAATTIVGINRPRYQRPGETSAREAGVVVIETYADIGGASSAVTYSPWTDAGCTVV